MSVPPKAIEHCSPTEVQSALSALMPYLAPYWRRPLSDYASAVYNVERFRSDNPVRRHAMDLLCSCIEGAACRSGYRQEEARSASRQLAASPALQTGPHCLLLIEPDAYYTHLFSLLGLKAHGLEWYITYHASTVSFTEKAKKGPGWLWLEGEPLNVFGLARSRMDSFSICGLNGPYRFAFTNATGKRPPNKSAAGLLDALSGQEYASAAEAIRAANQVLWRRKMPCPIRLLQLDDFDIADLVAAHLDEAASWLSARFFADGSVARNRLQAIDRLNTGPWQGWVRRTTDFFWGLQEGRIVPLHLEGEILRAGNLPAFEVKLRPDTIAAALRARVIVPSLYIAFLVISILPGVRALGGCRQTIYYPLMRYLTALGLQQSNENGLLTELRQDDRSGVWGHRVLKPANGYPLREIDRGAAVSLSKYARMPLVRASGDLGSFTRDPMWADLSRRIASGDIALEAVEWQLSGS
jgi:hypothetical protein